MIRKIIHIAAALLAASLLLVSCSKDDVWKDPQTEVPEGYISLRFTADIPAMQEVDTRAVDPDGGGVQDMTLFCFDSYGLFISTVKADVSVETSLGGRFTAVVPENTRTVHFLANQNMDEFKEDQFRNKSESEVMAVLEGSSGRMIYWARFACEAGNDKNIAAQMEAKGNAISLIRNHARISVANPNNDDIEITGFAVCNTNAFGTVAPYHPKKGFDFTWPSSDDPFVTLPANDAKMSDITDVTTNMGQYVFECENSVDDPVSVILRGRTSGVAKEKYYRVLLMDENGEQLLIRRNHHYKLNIKGTLSFGQDSFAEALAGAATNNVWISISDEVNEVEDTDYVLTVEKPFVVLDESFTTNGGSYTLNYTIKGKNGKTITDADEATVTWIDNGVATQTFEPTFSVNGSGVGEGHIQIHLLQLGTNEKQEGTLLVKKGRLQRKIKVITIKEQTFVPSWVGTEIYGDLKTDPSKGNRAHVTAMFTIPESCPDELFPMNVYLSVRDLDIRNASGMVLPVVRAGDKEWYSSGDISSVYNDSEPDYKFVYTAEGPGVQRVYFENILNQVNDYQGTLYIEAEYFATMQRKFKYSDSHMSISVQGLAKYKADESGIDVKDEVIYYRLVPQKRGANVQFDMLLAKRSDVDQGETNSPANAGAKDEFLLYSQFLDYYLDGEESDAGVETAFDCSFYPEQSTAWWNKYNPQGGRMLMFKPRTEILNNPPQGTGKYSIYMKTNRARSAEVIRIASNDNRYEPILSQDASADDPDIYGGTSYRSITFELANYNPFRFGARVRHGNEEWQGAADEPDRTTTFDDIPEKVTSLEWSYQPDQRVDIAIDVTSFAGSDGQSVDPFGKEFEIYIDAPMLRIDASRLAENKLNASKLKAHPSIPGRFIYTVNADRDEEREFGTDDVANKETPAVDQQGERKTLPFLINSTVSAGDIVISSNESQVVYYAKTFRVSNKSIAGTLQYRTAAGALENVPQNAFVSFERVRNGNRIGAVTVTADGTYELRLRKEYEFNWYADEVQLRYTDSNGNVYRATYPSLSNLFASPNIVLE